MSARYVFSYNMQNVKSEDIKAKLKEFKTVLEKNDVYAEDTVVTNTLMLFSSKSLSKLNDDLKVMARESDINMDFVVSKVTKVGREGYKKHLYKEYKYKLSEEEK